jgi:hypothetical protein
MTDRDVIERVAGMLGVKAHRTYRDRRNPDWKPLYVLLVRGRKAAELMQLVRPWMAGGGNSKLIKHFGDTARTSAS